MRVRNSPKRGDRIYFFGRGAYGESLREEDLLDVQEVKRLAEMVRNEKASAIFPVKSGGLQEVASFAASLAGGKAMVLKADMAFLPPLLFSLPKTTSLMLVANMLGKYFKPQQPF